MSRAQPSENDDRNDDQDDEEEEEGNTSEEEAEEEEQGIGEEDVDDEEDEEQSSSNSQTQQQQRREAMLFQQLMRMAMQQQQRASASSGGNNNNNNSNRATGTIGAAPRRTDNNNANSSSSSSGTADANDDLFDFAGGLSLFQRLSMRGGRPGGFGVGGSRTTTTTTASRRGGGGGGNLVDGAAFDASRRKKRELLMAASSDQICGPVAASTHFVLRPRPEHAVTSQQLRVTEESLPVAAFWSAYEDELDDCKMLLARKRLAVAEQQKNIKKKERKPLVPVAAEQGTKEEVEKSSSSSTPDRDGSRNNNNNNNNNNNKNNQQKPTSETEDEKYSADEYSPWAGPSPESKNRYNTNTSRASAVGVQPAVQKPSSQGLLERTVASTSTNSARCQQFLNAAPPLLPSMCRGLVRQGHSFQPISGVTIAKLPTTSSSSAASNNIHIVIGSRAGTLSVATINTVDWRNKLRATASSSFSSSSARSSSVYLDPSLLEDRREDGDAGGRGAGASTDFEITSSALRSSSASSSLLSLELEDVTMVRRGGNMLLDTAWHPTRRMFCGVGGAPEVILGYVPEEGDEDDADDGATHAATTPSKIGNILPLNPATQKRARSLVVDVNPDRGYRSYLFGCDFFGGDDQIVCGNSGGDVTVIKVRPDGRFHCQQRAIHAEDVNGVSRFGAEYEGATPAAAPLYVTGSDDRRVALCDERVEGGTVAFGRGCTNGLFHVANRGDGIFFASTSKDQTVRLWDSRNLSREVSVTGTRRQNLMHARYNSNDGSEDSEDDALDYSSWNHYNDPATAPRPSHTRNCQAALVIPNAHRFCFTLARCAFSPMRSTGGRYLLTGGVSAGQIIDIVAGSVVASLVWDEQQSADEMVRDVAWIDASTVLLCTQTTMHVFSI